MSNKKVIDYFNLFDGCDIQIEERDREIYWILIHFPNNCSIVKEDLDIKKNNIRFVFFVKTDFADPDIIMTKWFRLPFDLNSYEMYNTPDKISKEEETKSYIFVPYGAFFKKGSFKKYIPAADVIA